MRLGHAVLLESLLQASSGVVAGTPYAVVTLVELPEDAVKFTPGAPVCKESLQCKYYIEAQSHTAAMRYVYQALLCI